AFIAVVFPPLRYRLSIGNLLVIILRCPCDAGYRPFVLQIIVFPVLFPQALAQHGIVLGESGFPELLGHDVLTDQVRDVVRRALLDLLFRETRDRRTGRRFVRFRPGDLARALDPAAGLLAQADATATAALAAEALRVTADRRNLFLLAREHPVEIADRFVELLLEARLALRGRLARVLADVALALT